MTTEEPLLEATARVVSVDRDMAVLETKRTNACKGCGASAGCGTSALGDVFGQKPNLLHIKNDFDAVPGEQIIIGMRETDLVVASLAVYMVPLATMIGAALLVLALGFGDGFAALASMAGLGGGIWFASRLARGAGDRVMPVFLRRSLFPLASKACGT